MLQEKTIGFLGAGSMAEALIRGLLARGVVGPERAVGERELFRDLQCRSAEGGESGPVGPSLAVQTS